MSPSEEVALKDVCSNEADITTPTLQGSARETVQTSAVTEIASKKAPPVALPMELSESRRAFLKKLIGILAPVAAVTGINLRAILESLEEYIKKSDLEGVVSILENIFEPLVIKVVQTGAALFISKRSISAVLNALDSAQRSVEILGINSLGPLHQGLEKLETILHGGGFVSIGIMDPLGCEFIRREKEECEVLDSCVISSRLSCEWIASFGILRQLYLKRGKGSLDVWVHPEYPHGSLVIVDRNLVQYNSYQTEASHEAAARVNVPRGLTRPLKIYSRDTAPYIVEFLNSEFDRLRAIGRPLDLTNFNVPRDVLGRWVAGAPSNSLVI